MPTILEAPRLSPLARKILAKRGGTPTGILGTGPRGKIMAQDLDVEQSPAIAELSLPVENGYYKLQIEADLSHIAAIGTPLAVQCERLLGVRYSALHYITRASVKSCLCCPSWAEEGKDLDLAIITEHGSKRIDITNAAKKSIRTIATECRDAATPLPTQPQLAICDIATPIQEVMALNPKTIIAIGGTTPKASIECGRPLKRLILPVTLYVKSDALNPREALAITQELKTLLENPVLFLL